MSVQADRRWSWSWALNRLFRPIKPPIRPPVFKTPFYY